MKPVIKRTIAMLGLAMSMALLTACPGKDSGGGGGAAIVPVTPCVVGQVGCITPSGGGALVNLVSQGPASSPLLMQYTISGDANQIQQITASGQNVINYYTGAITVNGTMTAQTQVLMGNCVIPAGISVPFQATGQANGHGIYSINQLQVAYGVTMTFQALVSVIHSGSASSAGSAYMQLQMLQGPAAYSMYGTTSGALVQCPVGYGQHDPSILILR